MANTPKESIWWTKFVMLAHPPNPKPTTSVQTTTKMFKRYTATQLLLRNGGGFSTAFYGGKYTHTHTATVTTRSETLRNHGRQMGRY